ncbi:MAG: DUF4954 family protein [Prevotellaceae bacterium]|jgi:hypothetical protein|nr:DUF4954 family protein [Prevotellaceae bacterium]
MRQLTQKEIATMVVYGCSADDWKNIEVTDDFLPDFLQNVHFSGKISLGKFEKIYSLRGGVAKHSGVFNCCLHNVTVGDDVYINNIHNYIANYIVENEVFIENCDAIFVDERTAFGNGVRVAVVNESGCRAIPIFNKLSAPLAYLLTFFRNHTKFVAETERLISEFANKQSSETGKIGQNSKIVNCGTIINVQIAENAELQGITKLKNGSVGEFCVVGEGVQAHDFIFANEAKVSGAANLERCFVGEAAQIDKGFSAIDCVFFANCQFFNGEAVSVFAAPYTVSHHKSTLLIAGYFAFLNAGSAANQSNHLYKLGAVHQGVTERGAKLASNSCIAFPSHIGAFTTVLGTHKSHPNVADLPFSYLVENQGESWLVPAAALRSVGTLRDAQKWKKRDLRKTAQPLDLINFELFNPYTIGKILKAIKILIKLISENEKTEDIDYQNVKIKKTAAQRAIDTYQNAVYYFIGKNVGNRKGNTRLAHTSKQEAQLENWLDLAGLLASETAIKNLIIEIENEKFSLQDIQNQFIRIYQNFNNYLCEWIANLPNVDLEAIEKSTHTLREIWLADAQKEFNATAQIGYFSGDFEQTRGTFEKNNFVKELKNNIL